MKNNIIFISLHSHKYLLMLHKVKTKTEKNQLREKFDRVA
jgi:hypothetical protein